MSGYNQDIRENAYQGSAFYPTERRELDRLFSHGLAERTTLDAYFENITADQPSKERGQYYAGLLKDVNRIEGKFGFAQLENRHIAREIVSSLQDEGVFSGERGTTSKEKFRPGTNIYSIHLEVGVREETVATEELLFIASPIDLGSRQILPEEQWQNVEKVLKYNKTKFRGKMKYTVEVD